ncbi:MAG: uroporphyrinogen-III C-methyltransferase [Lachnospiraceae bacterium]|nr:uroporphyrinogen-III C-methyltransferase [Lachnospiraceae bacterium]
MKEKKQPGKVYLVGAGPGDAGLLTLKGKQVLEEAQVVVYDRLVGDGILAMIPKDAKLIDVGKRAGNHTMPQEQINHCLLEEARKGFRVVRLKGGDPFLFGRGGEELELLSENGIPYEVVPGITSPIAVPSYNGIPVTHRDYCSSVHIITGHQKNQEPLKIAFDALVRTEGTLVFLMGISSLDGIMRGLLDAGMDSHMPAAVLQCGTTARQKRIVAEVGTLSEEVKKRGVITPAIIIVGKVCALAEQFAWYEKLPLSGYKIVVTRPEGRSGKMSDLLRKMGAEVLELPAIATKPIPDNESLKEAIREIDRYQWIAFTSPYGVRVFFDALLNEKKDLRSLAGCSVAAIGEGTKKELQNRGIMPDLVPKTYDGESLGKALAEKMGEGERILLPRAAAGGSEILEELARVSKIMIDDIPVYETVYETSEIGLEQKLYKDGEIDLAVFTSASTVHSFAKAAGAADLTCMKAACIGHKTAAAAAEYGMKVYVAKEATLESLVDLAVQIKSEQQERK